MKSLYEILDWQLEWSALHGIAEIKNSLFKISTRTDATPSRTVLRLSKSFFVSIDSKELFLRLLLLL